MFSLALSAGHYINTPGKRIPASLDANETREWTLNSRVCEKIEKILAGYDGIEILRVDDVTGKRETGLSERTNSANAWGADLYLAIHHNAGINGGSGGGIVAYVYTRPSAESVDWQKRFYNELIEETGLKGNRSAPMQKANLHEVREPDMPAVLLELGFMDSKTDVPIILTDKFASQCAQAIAQVIIEKAKLAESGAQPPVAGFTPYLVRITTGALRIRRGAGTNTASVGLITDRGVYTIVDEADGTGAKKWGKLKSGAGWISLDYTRKL